MSKWRGLRELEVRKGTAVCEVDDRRQRHATPDFRLLPLHALQDAEAEWAVRCWSFRQEGRAVLLDLEKHGERV